MESVSSCLEKLFWPNGDHRSVWMIVDSARDPRIFEMLLECYLEYSCLYSGVLPVSLEASAPYLVQLEYGDRRSRKFLEYAWGNSWGIFLKCDKRLPALRRHLRGFLVVRDPSGRKLLFRYYDPRVLRVYLPTCSSEELRIVFGPIEQFWMESEGGKRLIEFGFDGAKLTASETPFEAIDIRRNALIATRTASESVRSRPGMLAVRKEQLALFSRAEAQKFESWMVSHLWKFFPQQCEAMRETSLRDLVQYGIRRAASHGLTGKRDVCKYIDVMIALGQDFDRDARYPWASRLLGQSTIPREKIELVVQTAKAHLRCA